MHFILNKQKMSLLHSAVCCRAKLKCICLPRGLYSRICYCKCVEITDRSLSNICKNSFTLWFRYPYHRHRGRLAYPYFESTDSELVRMVNLLRWWGPGNGTGTDAGNPLL